MLKELNYLDIEGNYGGDQEWFSYFSMRMGGCGAATACELLMYLAEHRSRVVERDELLNRLWDYSAEIETRTLDIHIRTLRQKLGEEGSRYIRTVRGVGYRFVLPEEEEK